MTLRPFFLLHLEKKYLFLSRSWCFSVKYTNGDKVNIIYILIELEEQFEDLKWVIRSRKTTTKQTTIYKILHRKLKIEQHEPY